MKKKDKARVKNGKTGNSMIETIRTQRNVIVHPSDLSQVGHVISTAVRSLIGSCNQERGYVIAVDAITYRPLRILRTGKCMYDVRYSMTCMIPCVGEQLECTVKSLFVGNPACLVEHQKIQIIIPNEKGDIYTPSEQVLVEIVSRRYDLKKKQYQCVGKLVKRIPMQ